jgi:ribosome-binding factor A
MAKKRPFARTDRLGSQIREVLATAVMRESREEILRKIVITDVEVTSDVSLARVYWTALPGLSDAEPALVTAALTRANGFLRGKVGEVIRARVTPELRFFHDDALDRGRRIDAILFDIAKTIPPEPPDGVVEDVVDEDEGEDDEDVDDVEGELDGDDDVEADDEATDTSDDSRVD